MCITGRSERGSRRGVLVKVIGTRRRDLRGGTAGKEGGADIPGFAGL